MEAENHHGSLRWQEMRASSQRHTASELVSKSYMDRSDWESLQTINLSSIQVTLVNIEVDEVQALVCRPVWDQGFKCGVLQALKVFPNCCSKGIDHMQVNFVMSTRVVDTTHVSSIISLSLLHEQKSSRDCCALFHLFKVKKILQLCLAQLLASHQDFCPAQLNSELAVISKTAWFTSTSSAFQLFQSDQARLKLCFEHRRLSPHRPPM